MRLLEQALRALGYEAVAHALEHASGIAQQPSSAAAFRAAVMSGDWSAALALLPSVAADPASVAASRFLILKRKFVEGLARGETADALQVLRTELQPLSASQSVLHSLAALLLRSPPSSPSSPAGLASLGTPSSSTGGGGRGSPSGGNIATGGAGVSEEQLLEGRAALLDELQDSLVPSLLIPERRLEELVEQAGGAGRVGVWECAESAGGRAELCSRTCMFPQRHLSRRGVRGPSCCRRWWPSWTATPTTTLWWRT